MTNRIKTTTLLLLTTTLFCSCNGKKQSENSGSSKETNDSTSYSDTVKSETSKSEELTWDMLYEASDGIAVESQIIRSSTTDAGDDVDNIVTYNSCLLDYETTSEEYSYRLYSDIYDEDYYKDSDPIPYDKLNPTRNSLYLMRDYVQGKDGKLIDKRLTRNNAIVSTYGRKDGSTSETVGIDFASVGFYNFFFSLSPTDFKKGNEKYSFVLDTENMQEPTSLAYTAVALTAGMSETSLKSLTLYTDGYRITSYEAEMEPVVADDWLPGVIYTFKTYAKGNIIAAGKGDETVTKHFLKKNEKTEDENLKASFERLKSGNYTETLSIKTKGDDETSEVTKYKRNNNTIAVLSSEEITSAYYLTDENKKQKLRYLNGGYYKDGGETVADSLFPTFDISTAMFDKTEDGKYHFSMIDTGVMDCYASLFTDASITATINELDISISSDTITVLMKGKDNTNSSFELTSVYSDIGNTDNGIDINNLKSMDDLTWKDILSIEDYQMSIEKITEENLNKIPLLNNGYFDVSANTYQDQLRFDYSIGNVYSLFDEDQNGIISKKETEAYYTFRDNLYSLYQSSLEKNGFMNITSTKENDHVVSMSATNPSFSVTVSMLEKDSTKRDITFRIAVII